MEFEKIDRYHGSVARQYDKRRKTGAQWLREQDAVDAALALVPPGSTILDIPAGTGRYAPLYKKFGLKATGMDASADMLAEAARSSTAIGYAFALRVGDIRKIDAADQSFDCVLCTRFLNWVDFDGLRVALAELRRVSRSRLIVGIRCKVSEPAPQSFWQRWSERRRQRRRVQKGTVRFHHDEAAVKSLFAELGLAVTASPTIERKPDGTEYRLYTLSRG